MSNTKLNTASIATRYPDDLAKIQAAYTAQITMEMITKSKDVLQWVKTQLGKHSNNSRKH